MTPRLPKPRVSRSAGTRTRPTHPADTPTSASSDTSNGGDGAAATTAARKRRTRSPHPGVVLIRPDVAARQPYWRARYKDPDTGREVKKRLDPLALRTAELRREWCIAKARELAKRRMALESGAPRATGTTITQGVALYFGDHPQLRDKTLVTYRLSTANFEAWTERAHITSLDKVGRPELLRFRAAMLKLPKRTAARRSKRGAKHEHSKTRSIVSVNRDLRAIGTVLNYLRKMGLLPLLTSDDLTDGLERFDEPKVRPEYLRPNELRQLFEAAARHDADVFAETRDEHAGLRSVGSTPKYIPVGPLVAGTLLTGMRLGEATSVTFDEVDLDALDHDGKAVGEIVLPSELTKTKHERVIGLGDVSPGLRALIAARKLAAGGKGLVFGVGRGEAEAASKRLVREYGAPKRFCWQILRSSCDTYLTNAPGIYGGASAYQAAKRLGHSVTVAESHYFGLVRGIPREARTLEAAMQIEAELRDVIERVTRPPTNRAARPRVG